jgi:hypothetical protein
MDETPPLAEANDQVNW